MAIPTMTDTISEAAYREFALDDPNGQWELYEGRLREKPDMSAVHGDVMMHCAVLLANQLPRTEYKVRVQHARLRVSSGTYYIPDIAVIPAALEQPLLERPGLLDAYADPLPLMIEVWSPSTGSYDVNEKIPGYRQRGDREIWRIHPFERTLTAWNRQSDLSYAESVYREGRVRPLTLPGVEIDLAALFSR